MPLFKNKTTIVSLLILLTSLTMSWSLYSYDRYDVVYTSKFTFVNEGAHIERIGLYHSKNDSTLRGVVLDMDSFNKILIGKPITHYSSNTTSITIGVMGFILALFVFAIGSVEETPEVRS